MDFIRIYIPSTVLRNVRFATKSINGFTVI